MYPICGGMAAESSVCSLHLSSMQRGSGGEQGSRTLAHSGGTWISSYLRKAPVHLAVTNIWANPNDVAGTSVAFSQSDMKQILTETNKYARTCKVPADFVLHVTEVIENPTKKEQKHRIYTCVKDQLLKDTNKTGVNKIVNNQYWVFK